MGGPLSTASPLLPLSTAVIDMLRMPEIARPCVVVAKKMVRSCWRGGAESELENTTNFLFAGGCKHQRVLTLMRRREEDSALRYGSQREGELQESPKMDRYLFLF